MSDTITLTREQFNAVLDQSDLIVSYADNLCDLQQGLQPLGLHAPAEMIAGVLEEIAESRNVIHRTMIAADDARPLPVKLRAYANWFRLFNKSNKEA